MSPTNTKMAPSIPYRFRWKATRSARRIFFTVSGIPSTGRP